ncbi:MAG TPA: class I SAM-dependent methyltransferase [Thermoanaerobaculia bacterium]|nr:class I SAM-dependent methyltransferase [Thermoanaerobaculia bacterium]
MSEDHYAKLEYRKLIKWDDRLRREWPFLDEVLTSAPSRSVLDLGSGTGEHARLLAAHGFEVLGIDSSPSMIEKAAASAGDGARFVLGDMRDLGSVTRERFGAAICLGNALPHLRGEDDLRRFASGLREVLLAGAPVVIQIINYDRIEAKRERALPLSFLADPDDPDASIIFLRAMELLPDRRIIFMPATLRMRTDREPPIELVSSRRVEIRGWRRDELEQVLRDAGFNAIEIWGSYQKAPFEAEESRDVIVVAR